LEETNQHLVDNYSVTWYRWRDMVFAIKFWFKVDNCCPIVSSCGPVCYL